MIRQLRERRARRERHGRVLAAELARYAADRDRAPTLTGDQLLILAHETAYVPIQRGRHR